MGFEPRCPEKVVVKNRAKGPKTANNLL